MSFHFVDRIYDYLPKKSIRGLKNVTRNEGFFYWLPNGKRVLSPAVVTEALCQLGGWLKMLSTDFTLRPVLLADEHTEYLGQVSAGDQIDLQVDVLDFSDDVVVTKGVAKVNGKPVLVGHTCRGYLLPLGDFDDIERVKKQFNGLYRPQGKLEELPQSSKALPAIAGHQTFETLRYVDGIIEHHPYKKVKAYKNIAACEPYFATHFPYKPCVPGVILLTFLGETSQYLLRENLDFPMRQRALVPTYIKNVRFRKFVEPGDQCLLDCQVIGGDPTKEGQNIEVIAKIFANNTRVMQAEMGFATMFASRPKKVAVQSYAEP